MKYAEAYGMWDIILKELHKESEREKFLALLKARPSGKVDWRVIELIKYLRTKKFKLGLLSNNSAAGASEARQIDLNSLFDSVLFSVEIGFMKPEIEVFKKLADALQVDATELIFIDDLSQNLSTASEIGYEPILYKDFPDLLHQLIKLNILNFEEVEMLGCES